MGPLNDRNKIKLPASQIGFIEFIVSPLWETWAEVINKPDCEPVRNMNQNRDLWAALKAEEDRLSGRWVGAGVITTIYCCLLTRKWLQCDTL
jgi:hypothetical protein